MHLALGSLLVLALTCTPKSQAKTVFAHYMVGTVSDAHARQDIDDAKAAGIDGFSLNIGAPSQPFVIATLNSLFNYASTVGFHLHISMDVAASGGDPSQFNGILQGYVAKPGYYQGAAGLPFITTFSDGGLTNDAWTSWKLSSLANKMYFCPDFDGTQGYYTADPGWWAYWGGVVDCLFSWESSWESVGGAGSQGLGSIETDQVVMNGAKAHGKNYMMGVSSLQYKDAYGGNWYRPGELTLVNRMHNLLTMSPTPDYVNIITWNDGPESHYVGDIWPESNSDADPARYVTSDPKFSHKAWLPLIRSFADAYRNGGNAQTMAVADGSAALGVMWYKSILQSSVCPNGDHPSSWELGKDQLNWALVIQPGTNTANYVLRIFSGSASFQRTGLTAGLNSNFETLSAGDQRMELWAGSTLIYRAQGGRTVSSGCPDGIFNMNPTVVGLAKVTNVI
ncbi:glycoside hydrolase [Mycena floridula]|nr:glycoside hydrolase [Mycena floridula]